MQQTDAHRGFIAMVKGRCGFLLFLAVWVAALVLAARLVVKRSEARLGNGGPASVEVLPQQKGQVPRVPVVPHTVELRDTVRGVSGHSSLKMIKINATRSDGATATRTEHVHRDIPEVTRMIRFPSGEMVLIDEIRGQMARHGPSADPPRTRDPRSECLIAYDGRPLNRLDRIAGRAEIQGHKIVIIQRGDITAWYAPGLNCSVLRLVVKYGTGISTQELASLVIGPPADELFSTSGYREVPSKDLIRKNRR